MKVKFEGLKLKKISKYEEETEGEDKVKYSAQFSSKDMNINIQKPDMFVGLIVGQEYKFTLNSDQTILAVEPEETEEKDEEASE